MSKTLCVFYSWAGNSREVSGIVGQSTGADVFELSPLRQYSSDYKTCCKEAEAEKRNGERPGLKALPDMEGYDAVVLCYPCWWGTMPMFFWTLLESCDTSGRRILPVCCNGGSGMGRSVSDIRELCPGSQVCDGLPVPDGKVAENRERITSWLAEQGL